MSVPIPSLSTLLLRNLCETELASEKFQFSLRVSKSQLLSDDFHFEKKQRGIGFYIHMRIILSSDVLRMHQQGYKRKTEEFNFLIGIL